MEENQKIIQHFLCICVVLFIVGLLFIKLGYSSTDSKNWIMCIIGFIMICFSLSVFIDYGLHKLWHLESK